MYRQLCLIIAAMISLTPILAQPKVASVQYWFDNEQSAARVSSQMEFDIDCSALQPGFHALHYRVADNAGHYSALQEHTFFKVAPWAEQTDITGVVYWLDNNLSAAVVSSKLELDINCSSLSPGFHTLHYRVADNTGRYSALQEHTFFKVATVAKATSIAQMQYWWDDFQANACTAPYSNDFVLSTEALPVGLHSLKYRVQDDAGRWSACHSHYFYKGLQNDSARIVSYSYWWNDLTDETTTVELETPAASFDIDIDLNVPANARTNYAGHYTAKLTVAVTDNYGRKAVLSSNVSYPDNEAPVTDIDADKYVSSSSVTISWTETSGDQMLDYNVYVSKDSGPFMLWLPDTKNTSATFIGERGSYYLFTVTGRDTFGNREEYDETKCVSVTFE